MQTETLTPLLIADSPSPGPVEAGIDAGICRLALAVFTQAVRDASSLNKQKTAERDSARAWLLEEGAGWALALGMRIKQADIERWIDAGCPPGDKRHGQVGIKRKRKNMPSGSP